jgi:hypothetical protein
MFSIVQLRSYMPSSLLKPVITSNSGLSLAAYYLLLQYPCKASRSVWPFLHCQLKDLQLHQGGICIIKKGHQRQCQVKKY